MTCWQTYLTLGTIPLHMTLDNVKQLAIGFHKYYHRFELRHTFKRELRRMYPCQVCWFEAVKCVYPREQAQSSRLGTSHPAKGLQFGQQSYIERRMDSGPQRSRTYQMSEQQRGCSNIKSTKVDCKTDENWALRRSGLGMACKVPESRSQPQPHGG